MLAGAAAGAFLAGVALSFEPEPEPLPLSEPEPELLSEPPVELEDDDASDEAAAGVAVYLAASLPLVAFFAESRLSFL